MNLDEWMIATDTAPKDLAAMLDISRQSVHNLRTRKFKPSLPLAMKIVKVTKGKVPLTVWLNGHAK